MKLTKKQEAQRKKAIKKALAVLERSAQISVRNYLERCFKRFAESMDMTFRNNPVFVAQLKDDLDIGRKVQALSFRYKCSIKN